MNPAALLRVRLLDDAADQPNDDNWVLPWDGYQGLSPEIYNAINDYFWDEHAFKNDYSDALQKLAIEQLEEIGIGEQEAEKLLERTFVYLKSGAEMSLCAEADDLFSLSVEVDCQRPERVVLRDQNSGEFNFFPAHNVALINMPLTQYQSAAQISMDELANS